MPSTPRYEQEEADAAAAEAAGIGGVTGEEELDPAQLPVMEAGGGVAEGFEESERALIEHASHGDQQSAHTILHDQGLPEEPTARTRGLGARPRAQQRAQRGRVSVAAGAEAVLDRSPSYAPSSLPRFAEAQIPEHPE